MITHRPQKTTHRSRNASWATGIAAVTCMAATLSACGSTNSASGSSTHAPGKASGKITIGISVYDMSGFETLSEPGVKAEAAALGDTLTWQSANGDVSQQISQIENFINQHVSAIIVDPVQSDSLGPQLKQARAAGIKVVATNVPVFASGTHPTGQTAITGNSPYVQSYVGPDDISAGKAEMTALAKTMGGHGNIVEIQGPLAQSSQASRTAGIADVLKQNPNIHLLASQPADWLRPKAVTVMNGFWAHYGSKINGIVSENDDMAIAANQVLASHQQEGKLPVVGIDGIQDGMNAVKKGQEVQSNLQDGMVEEGESVWLADQLARGKSVPKGAIYKMPGLTKSNVNHYYDQMYGSGHDAFLKSLPSLIASNMASKNYSHQ